MSNIALKNVRLSFPQIWKAVGFNESTPVDQHKYSATFLIEKGSENDKKMQQAIVDAANAKWGKKADTILAQIRGNTNKFAYQDGDLKEYDGYAGHMSIKASTKSRPLLVDKDRTPVVEDDGVLYAGCYVNAVVSVYAYDVSGNKGITAALVGIQFSRDGDAFGTSKPTADALFEDLTEGSEAADFI